MKKTWPSLGNEPQTSNLSNCVDSGCQLSCKSLAVSSLRAMLVLN